MIYKEIVHLNSPNKVLVEVLDARTIKLTVDAKPLGIIRASQKRIKEILVGDQVYLDINSPDEGNKIVFTIGGRVHFYEIKDITQVVNNVFYAHTEPRMKASYFVTPMLGNDRKFFRWDQYYVNTFVSSDYQYIILKYRFFNTEDYKKFEYFLTKHDLFIKMSDKDYEHVLFWFEVKESYKEDLKKFTLGQYSQMSDKYKTNILKFHKYPKGGELGQILYKTSKKRKQMELELGEKLPEALELYDKPKLEVELYQDNQLIFEV